MAKSCRFPLSLPVLMLLVLLIAGALAGAGARTAAAQQATCVTLCQQKVDTCAAECEALADAVYRDPASLRQCQLACAKGLFVACVERCSQTGEVTPGGYEIVAEDPDRIPASPGAPK
jgi:hypothetical protein